MNLGKGTTIFLTWGRNSQGITVGFAYNYRPATKTYIITPSHEYLATLDVPEYLLRGTIFLQRPEVLALHLGPDIPSKYGGNDRSLSELNCIEPLQLDIEGQEDRQNEAEGEGRGDFFTEGKESVQQCTTSTEEPKLPFIYSEDIGPHTIILDPEELKDAEDLLPNKMGARLAWADTDMLVKLGHGVPLAEAEALHLVAKRTTIAVPKLLSAYILDGTGYIIMSYEHGTPLEQYWDNASETEHQRILAQLTDYVHQMRSIEGNFIGGLDHSPCRDGVFEGGYGDHTKYIYGLYESEESFNEGMVQALRDRLPAKLLESENDPESNFWASEYILHQTVRGLKGHKIVFTHADLHEYNMLVRSDGTVVLLDWELSGFWPEYWEFYRSMFNPPWRTSWDRMVERFPHTMWNTT
ncbi:kinase-like domain-containing protein [Aspergillus minisclerotigenes]|uniref:Kinase-like domain-containing protein n=1 Tax=Aspergillus minisclerotigenes TaxID=656917 RepID=A0A5N6J9J0_9EURO|nr:kinase-like domain-containing protein [Aspergillus minisclerotigenes]